MSGNTAPVDYTYWNALRVVCQVKDYRLYYGLEENKTFRPLKAKHTNLWQVLLHDWDKNINFIHVAFLLVNKNRLELQIIEQV